MTERLAAGAPQRHAAVHRECPNHADFSIKFAVLLAPLAFFFLLLFLLLQEEKEGGALRRSAFRSATERSEALGAEMAAAQISIKRVFGHSLFIHPLAFSRNFCYPFLQKAM